MDTFTQDTTQATFLISVRNTQVLDLAEALKQAGIEFRGRNGLIEIDQSFDPSIIWPQVMQGWEIPYLVEGVNEYLQEEGLTPTVPPDHQDWSYPQSAELIHLAINRFCWQEDYRVKTAEWHELGHSWQEITREYPNLFG